MSCPLVPSPGFQLRGRSGSSNSITRRAATRSDRDYFGRPVQAVRHDGCPRACQAADLDAMRPATAAPNRAFRVPEQGAEREQINSPGAHPLGKRPEATNQHYVGDDISMKGRIRRKPACPALLPRGATTRPSGRSPRSWCTTLRHGPLAPAISRSRCPGQRRGEWRKQL